MKENDFFEFLEFLQNLNFLNEKTLFVIDKKIEKKQPKSMNKKINKVILFYDDETFETFTN